MFKKIACLAFLALSLVSCGDKKFIDSEIAPVLAELQAECPVMRQIRTDTIKFGKTNQEDWTAHCKATETPWSDSYTITYDRVAWDRQANIIRKHTLLHELLHCEMDLPDLYQRKYRLDVMYFEEISEKEVQAKWAKDLKEYCY